VPRGDPSAIVSQRVGELIERGLLAEDGLGVSSGGRAPRVVRFLADAGHLLVADLGATSIDVAVTDLSGVILGHAQEPCDIAAGPAPVLGQVEELFEQALRAAGPIPGELGAIGIGLPGPVEFVSGRPIAPPIMPGWDRYSVRERFAGYDVPIWVDNDVNLMALGELRAGSRVATTTSSSSRSAPASAQGSSSKASCTEEQRGAQATSGTSRWSRPNPMWCAASIRTSHCKHETSDTPQCTETRSASS